MGSTCVEATPIGFFLASDKESIRQAAAKALGGSLVLEERSTVPHTPEVFWTHGDVSKKKTKASNPGTELSGMVDMILLR